jgi:hypothetical protein
MQRFTFGIQRQFGNQFLAEIGYMGNRASGLGVPEQFGATPARYLSTSRERDQPVIDNLSTLVSNPFFGMAEFTGSNMTARTVSKAQLLSPYPQFNSVTTVLNRGAASFNALLARLERRFARGYTLQTAYTWSKNMDASSKLNASDPDPVRVISALDRTHRVTTSGVLELPFGRARRWASNARGAAGALAGGWSIQGIYIFQTGQPLAFGNVLFRGDIKEIVLDRGERSVERWFNVEAGFERDTRRQLASNIRTFPMRFSGVRGPGIGNIDLSLFKTFRISERIKLQFRAEGQNALNHAIFPVTANSPGVNPTASTFGQITQGENEQRRITLALKLMW